MIVNPTALPEVLILEPKVFGDERGFFFESFNARDFAKATGLERNFVQDNHSKSAKGVLRGLHYQLQQPQGKLVRVTQGEVFDVAADIRKTSRTFGQWVGQIHHTKSSVVCHDSRPTYSLADISCYHRLHSAQQYYRLLVFLITLNQQYLRAPCVYQTCTLSFVISAIMNIDSLIMAITPGVE